ncbi:unnamed protein product, partial [Urochloa humidicola]
EQCSLPAALTDDQWARTLCWSGCQRSSFSSGRADRGREASRAVLRFLIGLQRHVVEQWSAGAPPPPYARARCSLAMPAPPPGRVMAAPATGSNPHQDKCLPSLLFVYGLLSSLLRSQTLATTLVPIVPPFTSLPFPNQAVKIREILPFHLSSLSSVASSLPSPNLLFFLCLQRWPVGIRSWIRSTEIFGWSSLGRVRIVAWVSRFSRFQLAVGEEIFLGKCTTHYHMVPSCSLHC